MNQLPMRTYLDNTTLDNLLEGFQLIDFNWRYVYVNETAAKHGQSMKDILLPAFWPAIG